MMTHVYAMQAAVLFFKLHPGGTCLAMDGDRQKEISNLQEASEFFHGGKCERCNPAWDPAIPCPHRPLYPQTDAQRLVREQNFTYHSPKPGQPDRYAAMRDAAKVLAEIYDGACPPSRELALAMTNLEQSVFWANAAIARNE